jgi:hypothetical protein
MTGARRDHGTGVFDLQQTVREETPQMVGSQRVCKRHFQGYSKAQRMDFDEEFCSEWGSESALAGRCAARLGHCNYGGLIDTLFTDVEGVA